ncbi:hypothetical protein Nepgr_007569 [Nepenthes gracilis]|uniref:Uncharacterized protein n=1 Tax=Nepenthes gracilis TaxID=150966 RepID=A0AAD3XIG3_NEPGR|nr:hypothetical protein Nepgr_007569 [Nepenthes gracilis]
MPQAAAICSMSCSGVAASLSSGSSLVDEASCKPNKSSLFPRGLQTHHLPHFPSLLVVVEAIKKVLSPLSNLSTKWPWRF